MPDTNLERLASRHALITSICERANAIQRDITSLTDVDPALNNHQICIEHKVGGNQALSQAACVLVRPGC